jgi:(R,R)-butanediol dehydrogenase / meso-butanediol dehydrogenase / diacetyl reductase
MLAGLVTAPRRFELVEMPAPEPTPGKAVVAIVKCGICGTDLHGFLSDQPYNPAICGHEWVGTVTATGSGVVNVSDGERVIVAMPPACGDCAMCRAGHPAWCQPSFLVQVGRDAMAPKHGAFASHLAVNASRLMAADARLTDDQAGIVEPTTVALHAVRRTPHRAGDDVVVQGAGPIGLLTLQCARAAGAGRITVIEPVEHRRELALRLGADAAVPPEGARDQLSPNGPDVVYECAGVPSTFQSAVDLVRRGGTVNIVGLASGTATISPAAWLIKEVTVVASLGYLHDEFRQAMDLIATGRVDVDTLHDATIGLAELPATIERLAHDPSSAVKVLVDPTL